MCCIIPLKALIFVSPTNRYNIKQNKKKDYEDDEKHKHPTN